jgi:hypothetical protein
MHNLHCTLRNLVESSKNCSWRTVLIFGNTILDVCCLQRGLISILWCHKDSRVRLDRRGTSWCWCTKLDIKLYNDLFWIEWDKPCPPKTSLYIFRMECNSKCHVKSKEEVRFDDVMDVVMYELFNFSAV